MTDGEISVRDPERSLPTQQKDSQRLGHILIIIGFTFVN